MSTSKTTLSDDALLPSAAGAQSGAGQPAIAPWLHDDQKLTTHLTDEQRRWVMAVCEASRAQGGTLAPAGVLQAAIGCLMEAHGDPGAAAEALAGR